MPKLAEKLKVLLFAGDQDVICNYVGQERLIEKLEWRGATGMQGAETRRWVVNGTDVGTWQESRGLNYVKVRWGRPLLQRFLGSEWFFRSSKHLIWLAMTSLSSHTI